MVAPMPPCPPLDPRDPDLVQGYGALRRFFDRVAVVTLRRATARHAHLERALEGLPFELVYGTDKKDLDLAELTRRGIYDPELARKLDRFGREMTVAQVACALSHLAVWRQIAAGPHERVLVMEDDAAPYPPGVARLGEALAELPSSWELVYLGWDRGEVVTLHHHLKRLTYMALGALRLHYLSAREAANLLPRPFSPRLRRAGFHDLAHAYGLTRRGAQRLVEHLHPVVLPADTGITRVILRGMLEAYVVEPKAFYQTGADSYIQPGHRVAL